MSHNHGDHGHHDHKHGDHGHHHDHPHSGGSRLPIHPTWFYVLGFLLVMSVVLVWTFLL